MIRLLLIILIFLVSCTKKTIYPNQIGDTKFNKNIDTRTFTFCDSSNVLHKRGLVYYKGGYKTLEKELITKFNTSKYNFTGYFFIRFAINCKNETDRFRWDIVDNNYEKTECSKELEKKIIQLVKKLKGWQSPIYNSKHYDGYTFLVLKIVNGKIIES